jgi:carbon monoxide dehydrogenase subunit G
MEMKGDQLISADRQTVWEALNNPEVLKACIPGCETLEKVSDTELTATVVTKIGPVKAKFSGDVRLENLKPPESYSIVGEGKGGIAGFAKGGANVMLSEEEGGTRLTYTVDAKVGGKIAQLGSRLIDSTAKKLAGKFFASFSEMVGSEKEE